MIVTEFLVFCVTAAILIDCYLNRRKLIQMALDLTALTAAVAANTTATTAAVNAIAAAKAEPDQSALDSLTSEVVANNAAFTNASTPAA